MHEVRIARDDAHSCDAHFPLNASLIVAALAGASTSSFQSGLRWSPRESAVVLAIARISTSFILDFYFKGVQRSGVKFALVTLALFVGGMDLVATVIGLDPSDLPA